MCAWDPPPGLRPPPPDHNSAERIDVLFPRRGAFKASMEVKKRVLKSVPHMGGKRLKQLVRHHARHGTMNSFVGDFESRLDKFLYRLNLVPSIFTARHAIGLRNVLVNGRSVNSPGHLLKPMDIVEPRPGREFLFKRWIRERLNRNTCLRRRPRRRRAARRRRARAARRPRRAAGGGVIDATAVLLAAGAKRYDLNALLEGAQEAAAGAAGAGPRAAAGDDDVGLVARAAIAAAARGGRRPPPARAARCRRCPGDARAAAAAHDGAPRRAQRRRVAPPRARHARR